MSLALTAAVAAGLPVAGAGAVSGSGCSAADQSQCLAATVRLTVPGSTVSRSTAASPVDLVVSVDDTAPTRGSDPGTWLRKANVALVRGLGGRTATRSRDLPGGLLVAGSTSDCGSGGDFSACAAGHGTFDADVSGTGGAIDGIGHGTFGIQRIVNVAHPGTHNLDRWRATLQLCLDTAAGCNAGTPSEVTLDLVIPKAGAGRASRLVLPLTVSFAFADGTDGQAQVDGALDTVTALRVSGTSNRMADGSVLSRPRRIMSLPPDCGRGDVAVRAVTRAGAEIELPLETGVTGCPTAKLSATEPRAYHVELSGRGSSTSIDGRAIRKYHWDFGDRRRTTTTARVKQSLSSSADRTVSLVVEDTAGALSHVRKLHLKGTTVRVHGPAQATQGQRVTLHGRLVRWHTTHGLGGRPLDVLACNAYTGQCDVVDHTRTSSTSGSIGHFTAHVTAAPVTVYFVRFSGGDGYIGSDGRYDVAVS